MAFRKRDRRGRRGGVAGAAAMPVRAGLRLVAWSLRLSLALVVLGAFAALVLWMRLSAGPVEMPWLARALAEQFNRYSANVVVEAEAVVVSLGEPGQPAGVAFTGLRLGDADGTPLLSVPRVAARFNPSDLLFGRLQPTEITLSGAAARVVRGADGRVRLALREGAEPHGAPARVPDLGDDTRRMDAIGRILDGFVGDAPPVPELARLQSVSIRDADLTYVNLGTGRRWHSERADLELRRTPGGAVLTAVLAVSDSPDGAGGGAAGGTALTVTAQRRRGAGATEIVAEVTDIRPSVLAEEVPELGWLAAIDARLSGRLGGALSDAGSVGALTGTLRASDGRLLAVEEEGLAFERFALDFGYDPSTRRMRVDRLEIESAAADLDLSGFADLSTDAAGQATGVAGQLDIAALRVALPQVFEQEQRFDEGQIVARVDFAARTVEIAEARLHQGPLTLSVGGRISPGGEGGWTTDLRAVGHDIAAERLVALWPLRSAKGARRWLAKNLRGGTVDAVVAQLRLGRGTPDLALDFRFSGVETAYLKEMTPIRGGAGRGHMTWQRLDLEVEAGEVEPVPGQTIDIAGSTLVIPDVGSKPAHGEITVKAKGPASAVLALIDQEPLNLASKAKIDPARVAGSASVETVLRMPFEKGLKLSQVDMESSAVLTGVAMPYTLELTGPLSLAADRLELEASLDRLTLGGPITANGTPLRLDWDERFRGPAQGRQVKIAGRATPAVLEGIGRAIPGFDGGSAPFELSLTQAPGAPSRFAASADLTPAKLTVEPVFWNKGPGLAAKVTARGQYDGLLAIDEFALSGPGLEAGGSLRLFPEGGIEQASIGRLEMGALADLTVEVAARPAAEGGGFALEIGGRRFDLAFLDRSRNPAEPPVTPVAARYSVDQVKVTEQIGLGSVRGSFERDAGGRLSAALTGQVGGTAPVEIRYDREPGAPGRAHVTADDAGQVLKAAGVFAGAERGSLVLDATIAPEPGVSFAGDAVLRNVVVQQEARTFRRVLERGALDTAAEEAGQSGLAFDRVEVPFRFRGDRIEIDTAIASSPSLAIKASGVVNEATRALNLRGVISPAYALTGALNNIPLIGTLLGGEGEGVLAMTFSVTGSTAEPRISVNPLSLLAPGFLRNIFEGDALSEAAPPIPSVPAGARVREAEKRTPPPPPRSAAEQEAAADEQRSRLERLLGSDL